MREVVGKRTRVPNGRPTLKTLECPRAVRICADRKAFAWPARTAKWVRRERAARAWGGRARARRLRCQPRRKRGWSMREQCSRAGERASATVSANGDLLRCGVRLVGSAISDSGSPSRDAQVCRRPPASKETRKGGVPIRRIQAVQAGLGDRRGVSPGLARTPMWIASGRPCRASSERLASHRGTYLDMDVPERRAVGTWA
ncbi:hypothetical protein DAEQUDRAFT_597587 [Daedalea quercina L-15889]|uniref:Uncharacterized protein n=1 Tax=Daedalea quercina L-15889 TaxID=1314783 RepID=A0A165LP61_9APHY|nr:hypothetical protein DAEQUDRAFT_597587 [Daedalea quercina L-15889]